MIVEIERGREDSKASRNKAQGSMELFRLVNDLGCDADVLQASNDPVMESGIDRSWEENELFTGQIPRFDYLEVGKHMRRGKGNCPLGLHYALVGQVFFLVRCTMETDIDVPATDRFDLLCRVEIAPEYGNPRMPLLEKTHS